MDYGHWTCGFEFDPCEWFGFIYRIVDCDSGKEYIGKKQFSFRKRKIKKGAKRATILHVNSDWKSYTGSSVTLNAEIKERGKERFRFFIESLHSTKGSLFYAEIEAQVLEDVLRAKLETGDRRYYNQSIANVKFIPKEEASDRTRQKISERKKEYFARFLTSLDPREREEWLEAYHRGNNNPTKNSMNNGCDHANPMLEKDPLR